MSSRAMILRRETSAGPIARRRRLHVLERAVDAVADGEAVLARLDMDVRRAHLDGARDELVGEADDRRAARHVLEALDIALCVDGLRLRARRLLRCARRGIEPLVRRLDVAQGGDARLDALLRAQLDGADRHLVERIGHRQGHRLRPVGERQHLGMAQEIAAEQWFEQRLFGELGRIGDGDAEPQRQGLGHVALGDEAELGQQRQEMLVARRRAAPARGRARPG